MRGKKFFVRVSLLNVDSIHVRVTRAKINATEFVVLGCRAAMPTEMSDWGKHYISIFGEGHH